MTGQPVNPTEDPRILQRNAAATAFVGFLIGLAYQEAVAPVRTSIRDTGITFVTSAMFLTFFLAGLAAFIAAYYALILGRFKRLDWLLKFAMHIVSSTILIFMGGLVSAGESAKARYGFVDLLFLYAIIALIWSLGTLVTLDKAGRQVLWPHTVATLCSFLAVLGVQLLADDRYARLPIAVLAAVAVLRFLATVILFWRQRLL